MKPTLTLLPALLLAPLAALHAVEPAVDPPAKTKQWSLAGPLGQMPSFDGPALDTDKWTVGMSWWRGRQPACFKPSNVAVRAGQLHLTMRREPVPADMEKHGYKDYTSAALQSRTRSSYGYYEITSVQWPHRGVSIAPLAWE